MIMLIVKHVERMCRMGVTGREISDRHNEIYIQCNVISVSCKAEKVGFVIADRWVNYLLKL